MLFRCKCGRTKAGQPWKATGVKPWVCDACRDLTEIVFVGRTRLTLHLKPGETHRFKPKPTWRNR